MNRGGSIIQPPGPGLSFLLAVSWPSKGYNFLGLLASDKVRVVAATSFWNSQCSRKSFRIQFDSSYFVSGDLKLLLMAQNIKSSSLKGWLLSLPPSLSSWGPAEIMPSGCPNKWGHRFPPVPKSSLFLMKEKAVSHIFGKEYYSDLYFLKEGH